MKRLILLLLLTLTLSSPIEAKKIYAQMLFESHCILLDDGTSEKPKMLKNEVGKDMKF